MIKAKSLRAEESVFEMFRQLCDDEGRKQGKMLEILLNEYLKKKESDEK